MIKYLSHAVFLTFLVNAGALQAEDQAQKIYDTKCSACHIAGVAGAPKLDDAQAWAPRLEKGTDGLLETVKNGLGAMPPMGTCNDCSDEVLVAIIELMIAGVK